MTEVRMEWHGEEAKALIDKAIAAGGAAASISLGRDIRTSMPGAGAMAIGRTRKGKGRTIWKPSNPGEPPGVRTRELKGSVQVNGVRVTAATPGSVPAIGGDPGRFEVGTADDKAAHLEYGTVNMPARPFLRPMLRNGTTHKRMVSAFIRYATRVLGGDGTVGRAD